MEQDKQEWKVIQEYLKRDSVHQKWKEIIAEVVLKYKLQKQPVNSKDVAEDIMQAVTNQENE